MCAYPLKTTPLMDSAGDNDDGDGLMRVPELRSVAPAAPFARMSAARLGRLVHLSCRMSRGRDLWRQLHWAVWTKQYTHWSLMEPRLDGEGELGAAVTSVIAPQSSSPRCAYPRASFSVLGGAQRACSLRVTQQLLTPSVDGMSVPVGPALRSG